MSDLNWFMPDPAHTDHDPALTAEVRRALHFLSGSWYIWADEDGRMFVESYKPLTADEQAAITEAGYDLPMQPTVGSVLVQYQLVKRA